MITKEYNTGFRPKWMTGDVSISCHFHPTIPAQVRVRLIEDDTEICSMCLCRHCNSLSAQELWDKLVEKEK